MIHCITSTDNDCNCYIISENGRAIIVDPSCAEPVVEYVESMGLEVDYILLTHEHFDHVIGLEVLRKTFAATVVATKTCSDCIQEVRKNLSNVADMLTYFRTGEVREVPSERFTCEPADMTFGQYAHLVWEYHSFDFTAVPGHSPGSVLITMDGDAVFTGDYLIPDEEVITRLSGGNTEDYEKLARPVLDTIAPGTHIYPGHGQDYIK